MALTLRPETVAAVIRRVLTGKDHRDIIVDLIDAAFVSDVIQFFEQIVRAKIHGDEISLDWYKRHFLNKEILGKDDLAWNAGLNLKTISNKRKSQSKEIVIEEALAHHDKFLDLVESLADEEIDVDLSLTLKDVTVHLSLSESLVVINALAVRRAALRGGLWSTVGKQVEGPLMEVLCRIFSVDEQYFTRTLDDDGSFREIDFYLRTPLQGDAKCEVKLMGKGNPESADAVIARESRVFVASTLSDTNKTQLSELDVLWTELQVAGGFLRFQDTLRELGIPFTEISRDADYSADIERAISATLSGN